MELLLELFITVVIAILISFIIAKFVSLGGGSHSQSQNLDRPNNTTTSSTNRDIDDDDVITEELSYTERLQLEKIETEKKVEFVQDYTQKVDELVHLMGTECTQLPPSNLIQASFREEEEKEEDKLVEEENRDVIECSVRNDVVLEQEQQMEVEEEEEISVVDCEKDTVKKEEKVEIIESDDDDWEGIERSELEKTFAKAAKFVESGNKDEGLDMELYGLHKVATEGPCHQQPPYALKVAARAKCDGGHCLRCARNAWQRLGNMNPEVAMEQYVALVSDKVPGWMEDKSTGNGEPGSSEAENPGAPVSDLSTSSSHHPIITEERIPEVMPDDDKNVLTVEPTLESRAKD